MISWWSPGTIKNIKYRDSAYKITLENNMIKINIPHQAEEMYFNPKLLEQWKSRKSKVRLFCSRPSQSHCGTKKKRRNSSDMLFLLEGKGQSSMTEHMNIYSQFGHHLIEDVSKGNATCASLNIFFSIAFCFSTTIITNLPYVYFQLCHDSTIFGIKNKNRNKRIYFRSVLSTRLP